MLFFFAQMILSARMLAYHDLRVQTSPVFIAMGMGHGAHKFGMRTAECGKSKIKHKTLKTEHPYDFKSEIRN
jgi:hypothetical protein